jgi:ABC-type transporter Mla maintaining outer membrane lipid asymmetry ATPase subunit MlaF
MPDRIELVDVTFGYGGAALLRRLRLSLARGEVVIIGGKSGQGMTTLLELCVGLLAPQGGRVLWDGEDIRVFSREEMLKMRYGFGFMFQVPALISNFGVFDNLALPLRNRPGSQEQEVAARVRAEMDRLGLYTIDKAYPEALSKGQLKTVALGRALITDPSILLLDEPLSGVDPDTARMLSDTIQARYRERSMGMMVISHDLHLWPNLPARRLVLDNGYLAEYSALNARWQQE